MPWRCWDLPPNLATAEGKPSPSRMRRRPMIRPDGILRAGRVGKVYRSVVSTENVRWRRLMIRSERMPFRNPRGTSRKAETWTTALGRSRCRDLSDAAAAAKSTSERG